MATQPIPLSGESAEFLAATADVPEILGDSAAPPTHPDGTPLQPGEVQIVAMPLSVSIIATTFGTLFAFIGARLGEDGKFWELEEQEKNALATAWLPYLNPLWEKWVSGADPNLMMALLMTTITVGPRLIRTNALLASRTASTVTGKSGALSSSQGQPVPASQQKPTDLSPQPIVA